jgi:hypothetical protein
MMENQIEIYTSQDGSTQIEVKFEGDTFWLNLNQISSLFDRDKSVISRHLSTIFTSGELIRDSVVAKNATTAKDGKSYSVEFYNLDAILSVGYRVNSKRGTQFRQWATKRLKDYLIEGLAINEKRLEQKNKARFWRTRCLSSVRPWLFYFLFPLESNLSKYARSSSKLIFIISRLNLSRI